MIRHVVMWKFKDEAENRNKSENLRLAREALLLLPSKIPGIVSWEVGENVVEAPESYDLVLIALFDRLESLRIYQTHPAHLNVVEFLRKVRLFRTVVDCVHQA